MPQFVFNPFTGNFDAISDPLVFKVPFSYTTTSPLVLQAVVAGQVLNRCTILITTAFDDPGAFITLGTTADPSLVFGASDARLSDLGNNYDNSALFPFSVSDFLQLTISPGSSTQGAGLLLYKLR